MKSSQKESSYITIGVVLTPTQKEKKKFSALSLKKAQKNRYPSSLKLGVKATPPPLAPGDWALGDVWESS